MNYNEYGLRVEYIEYTVKKGDSLYTISKEYKTTVQELTDINMLTSNTIFPGQVLLVPKLNNNDEEYYFENYIVEKDDTIYKIAEKAGVDPVLLGLYNDFANFQILPGQTMKIPRNNTYIVRQSDTVDSILKATNRTAEDLLKANAGSWLRVGTKIYL